MTLEPGIALRLKFLARVVRKKCLHLPAAKVISAIRDLSGATFPHLEYLLQFILK